MPNKAEQNWFKNNRGKVSLAFSALTLVEILLLRRDNPGSSFVGIAVKVGQAVVPNLIASLIAFIVVFIKIGRQEQVQRYIEAMRSIRMVMRNTPAASKASAADVQNMMEGLVANISTLYFDEDQPPDSGTKKDQAFQCLSCNQQVISKQGRCEKCHDIAESWLSDKVGKG
jgi:uncharacterized paraquat-inducible protein A